MYKYWNNFTTIWKKITNHILIIEIILSLNYIHIFIKEMKQRILTLFSITIFLNGYSFSQTTPVVVETKNSPNIIEINNNSIILAKGSTYSYTVDTPKDEGLITTDLNVEHLKDQIQLPSGGFFNYTVYNSKKEEKTTGGFNTGDILEINTGNKKKSYSVKLEEAALSAYLTADRNEMTVNTTGDITLDFIAGQRTPRAQISIYIPIGINVTLDNTTVNVIGRGEVTLRNLPYQSIGKTGTNYSYQKVGNVSISNNGDKGQILTFSEIDLRPLNGIDLRIKIKNVSLSKEGNYTFQSDYNTTEPQVYKSRSTKMSSATIKAVSTISDFTREMPKMFTYKETQELFLNPVLKWSAPKDANSISLMQSIDEGKTWSLAKNLNITDNSITTNNLIPNTLYMFKLVVKGGVNKGESNITRFFSGKLDVKSFGAKGDDVADDTDNINKAITYIHEIGGGILSFTNGNYKVRTVQLKSNVWLHVDKSAAIKGLLGQDAPESTWFSDRDYRAGLSPTDPKPYANPENWLTKQDVGHTFFRNAMFFAEREDNIKIFGNGRITGNGSLVNSDGVMKNSPEKRADKMFTFKLCTNIEIGGYNINKDMWYDAEKDEPYYIETSGSKNFELDNVLHIDRGGHFVLLATGTDTLNVHDTYLGKYFNGNARDIYDFMACNSVSAVNIYSKMSSDDIVKLGSDCSLGFTRPVKDYTVRNIIGDTNCNLFQIGSETADDIQDVYVDNIYVLGSNKAGFSISTNDGANIKNVFLNTGHTGTIHSRSKMFRTRAPFFISISNRGRVIGADVQMFSFKEGDNIRKELLCTNSNIGSVENIIINDIDIAEVYGGSSHSGKRWAPYDNSKHNKATPIIAGYKLPDSDKVEGGLTFRLPNGVHTGYITNIQFNNVNLLVKGGNPASDANASPPEIGVGRYNVNDLRIQPSYGFWFRHAKDIQIKNCTIKYEEPDGRHAIVLDDVIGGKIESVEMPKDSITKPLIKLINSKNIVIE